VATLVTSLRSFLFITISTDLSRSAWGPHHTGHRRQESRRCRKKALRRVSVRLVKCKSSHAALYVHTLGMSH
jgi:hypothetical protein